MEKPNADCDRTTRTLASPCRFVVSGYVTWSSTSCGLCPGQSVKTMTWLSDRSGIASIGVDVSAHQPQPARPRYRTTTMNRFFSATSMSRLIILASQKRRRIQAAKAVRACSRKTTCPDVEPEQTHDDGEWLDEEDGEQDVPGNRRAGYRRR